MKKYFIVIVLTLIAASGLAWHRTQSIAYIPPAAVVPSSQVAAVKVPHTAEEATINPQKRATESPQATSSSNTSEILGGGGSTPLEQ